MHSSKFVVFIEWLVCFTNIVLPKNGIVIGIFVIALIIKLRTCLIINVLNSKQQASYAT